MLYLVLSPMFPVFLDFDIRKSDPTNTVDLLSWALHHNVEILKRYDKNVWIYETLERHDTRVCNMPHFP